MLGLPAAFQKLSQVDLEGYPRRTEAGIGALAVACGLSPEPELARFRSCRDFLGVAQRAPAAADLLAQVTESVTLVAPLIVELVATYSGDGLKGFGFLTQGRPSGPLPANLAGLLSGTLQMHLTGGGRTDEAELLADVFRLAFPNLGGLAGHSPLSQGMIVGVVPAADALTLKVYFNTRLDPSGNHRERVASILARCGLADDGLYDLLYAGNDGARFHGVGIDLDGDGCRRAKIYVRLNRAALLPALEKLATHLQPDMAAAARGILNPVLELIEATKSEAQVDEVELAAALCSDAPATAKVTLFFAGDRTADADLTTLDTYLQGLGYPAHGLDAAVKALAENAHRAVAQRYPLHGVGIEVPVASRPKINVYLQPVL
ncbi:MAG: hypothetical protein HY903_06575 [Deltaproteobacteria bacterium]|nr:hypothetical protein [Deltaproteobacteria bacterium]